MKILMMIIMVILIQILLMMVIIIILIMMMMMIMLLIITTIANNNNDSKNKDNDNKNKKNSIVRSMGVVISMSFYIYDIVIICLIIIADIMTVMISMTAVPTTERIMAVMKNTKRLLFFYWFA